MRVIPIKTNPRKYSSRVYLILGKFNVIGDLNTLIDTGSDGYIINELKNIYTGVGKKTLDQIILTHGHFDHTGGIKFLKEAFDPKVFAFNSDRTKIDRYLKNNDIIKCADTYCQIIHAPIHSNDSVCIYFPDDGALFTGDLLLDAVSQDSSYTQEYLELLLMFSKMNIRAIYPGHGNILNENINAIFQRSINIVKKSLNLIE